MYRNFIQNMSANILFRKQIMKYSLDKLGIYLINPSRTVVASAFSFCENNIQDENLKLKIANENPFGRDEYITLNKEHTRKSNKEDIIDILRYNFRVSDSEVSKLLNNEKIKNWEELKIVLDLLFKKGVYKRNILNNAWLLKTNSKLLQAKFEILSSVQFNDVNHFVPLFKHSIPRLEKLVNRLVYEQELIPGSKNRLYYISERLNLDPGMVCAYLSNRLFVFEMPFEMLQKNLNHMIKYGVAPLSILKDLWAFRYTPNSVKVRLERAKEAKKNKIMPWMVRCPENILQKSLKLSLDEIKILGEDSTVIDYISERLDIDKKTMGVILQNHLQVLAVRVTKIKEILDYLLDKEGFSKYDIARVPRVLCHGLETTKSRVEELKSIGCRPTSLIILCRSRREYEKFVEDWLEKQKRIKERHKSI